MQVLVLANEDKRSELLSGDLSSSLKIHFVDQPVEIDFQPDACIDLQFDQTEKRAESLRALKPGLIIVDSMIGTSQQFYPDFVRINSWTTFLNRSVWELAGGNALLQESAGVLAGLFGKKVEWVPDQPGFISPRVISSIINEAFYTLEEGVSTEAEIDTAMKLGTNYPYGPFEWGGKIGLGNIYILLKELGNNHERYRPSSLLKQKALA